MNQHEEENCNTWGAKRCAGSAIAAITQLHAILNIDTKETGEETVMIACRPSRDDRVESRRNQAVDRCCSEQQYKRSKRRPVNH